MKSIYIYLTALLFIALYSHTAMAQKSELMIQTGHQKIVMHSSISPDETKLFTVDYNYVGILWDLTTGKQLRIFQDLIAADFGSDSRTISLAMNNKTFKTVDLMGNALTQTVGTPVSQKLTNWERTLYGVSNVLLYKRTLIDVTTSKEVKMETTNHNEGADFSPALRQVAFGESGHNDGNGTVDVCDAQSGALLRSIPVNLGSYENAKFIGFSSDGKILLVGSSKKVHIFDFATGAIRYTYSDSEIKDAILAPDGKTFLVTNNGELQLLNAQNGRVIWTKENKNSAYRFHFNASATKIVAMGDNIEYLDASTGAIQQSLLKHATENLYHLFNVANQQQLLTQGNEKLIIRWNLVTGTMDKALETDKTRYGGTYKPSPDGKKLLLITENDALMERDLVGTSPAFEYPKASSATNIWALDVSSDNRYALIASYYEDKNPDPLQVFDLNTHQTVATLTSSMQTGAFAKTKNMLATQKGWDTPTFNFYDIPSGRLLYEINDPTIRASATQLLFSPDDRYLAFKHQNGIGILNIAQKKIAQLKEAYADTYTPFYYFSPDSRYFILGSNEGSIDFYNLQTQQQEPAKTIKAHLGSINGITFSQNGRFMFTAGGDNTIKVWDMETTKPTLVATLYSFAATGDWAVVTPKGHFDATPGAQENMYYVNGLVVIPMSAMYEKFYAPRLLMRILGGERIDPVDVDVNKLSAPPTVKILPPTDNGLRNLVVEDDKPNVRHYEMSNNKITLTVTAACPSGGVSEIRLFHNGKIIGSGTRNLVVEDENKVEKQKTQKFDIQLIEGDNDFRAIALNTERTESQPDEISIRYKSVKSASPEENATNLYLVVVGINKYKNPKYALNYASADATAFKEALEKNSASIFNKMEIVYLGDDAATKGGIVAALDKIKTNATAKDVFIFYYAGHGVLNEKKTFYLVPQDVTQLYGADDALAQKGLSATELQGISKDIKAQKQLFILDACQSAGALEQIVASRGAAEEKAIAQLARSTGTHWLTASGSEQYASEFAQLGHGTFTYVLLQGLSGKADLGGDRKITVKEIDAYLQEQVPEITAKYKGTAQYPSSYSYGNDFPIIIVK